MNKILKYDTGPLRKASDIWRLKEAIEKNKLNLFGAKKSMGKNVKERRKKIELRTKNKAKSL